MGPLIDVTRCDDVPVVHLHGEFDIATVNVLTSALDALTHDRRPRIVVDLSGVTFIDCATIGVLVGAAQEAAARGGGFAVVCPDPKFARVLALTDYSASWPVLATLDDAVDLARLAQQPRAANGHSRSRAAPAPTRIVWRLPAWLARHLGGAA